MTNGLTKYRMFHTGGDLAINGVDEGKVIYAMYPHEAKVFTFKECVDFLEKNHRLKGEIRMELI